MNDCLEISPLLAETTESRGSDLKQFETYYGAELVNLNCDQMTRTTPELAFPNPYFQNTKGTAFWETISLITEAKKGQQFSEFN
ncbi:hypothetical protein AVEN_238658-1 [Araneus ventricosus]|uniref:Uncharacterized protein n=1 Tax=Araneus ventricosus TaxID=182803 RepID=A0A4Y2Q6J7_ARAVE|nr:hypothetical protein AVEN_238658-1 [Araneus ventricosus]